MATKKAKLSKKERDEMVKQLDAVTEELRQMRLASSPWQPLTRGGYEYRIYATDGTEDYPIHGAVKCPRGWRACEWTAKGRLDAIQDGWDLLPMPKTKAKAKGVKR